LRIVLTLTNEETAIAAGRDGEGAAVAMRLVAETGRLLGADRLVAVASAHIDGCLYHGDSGTEFAEFLVARGAKVQVPSTLNVGALDLRRPGNVRLSGERRNMALRLMQAYEALGCRPTWTCAPYQAGHRPATGTDVAWGESNAVAFCNSVLGARTNRYGDFLDIACAISGRAPGYGLHLPQNRRATLVVDTSGISDALKRREAFWPVLGAWLGRFAGERIAVIDGLAGFATEDRLKALGAASASTGAVALFHVAGVTPEAASVAAIADATAERVRLTPDMLRDARALLSTASGDAVDAVAIGSPHCSLAEAIELSDLIAGRRLRLPLYLNTGRHILSRLEREGRLRPLTEAGVVPIVDTCVVVTPILPAGDGKVLMTNSGKFAFYAPGNTGYAVQYGSMADCVATAVAGRLVRDETGWR
jgi:predicted aconitase